MSFDPTVEIPIDDPGPIGTKEAEPVDHRPVIYAAAALALVAMLISLVALFNSGDSPTQVKVGDKICLVQDIDDGDSSNVAGLFCQT